MASGRLQGKVAVVTGSNSGMGRSIAIAYGKEGATVICASRRPEAQGKGDLPTHEQINKNGGKAEYHHLQFTETESINNLIQQVVKEHGRIDVWFSNAGTIGTMKPIHELTDEEFDSTIDTNLKGCFRCLRSVAAQMQLQPLNTFSRRGSIISMTSVFGPRGWPSAAAYSASKMGVVGMTTVAATDLSKYGINVNCISPGTVMTKMNEEMAPDMTEALGRKALLGFGVPEDITGLAVLLAGEEGRWIQGQQLFIDGGFTIT